MFTQEAINQALSLWLGATAIGLAISLVIAFFSTRGGQTAHDHGHHDEDHHGGEEEAH